MRYDYPLMLQVAVHSSEELRAVYAVLAGVVLVDLPPSANDTAPAQRPPSPGALAANPAAVENAATADLGAGVFIPVEAPAEVLAISGDKEPLDAHGHPWSAALHASTKTLTGEGLWRMKPGQSRPEPAPGYPKVASGNAASPASPAAAGATEPVGSSPTPEPESAAASQEFSEDDEFAAFQRADAATSAPATAAEPMARTWTDSDLSDLCNQAATTLNDAAPVKALIAEFVPEGEVPHSRNIPADRREAFAQAIEAKAGIEYAG